MRELPPRAVVSSRTVFDLIWKLDENAEHDVPLSDHSTFAADDLRLVLNDSTDGVPRVAPFLDLDAFVSNATHDFYDNQHKRLDPVLVPTAVTPELEKHKEGIHPGLCWAVLFHRMCDEFLRIEASRFFSEHETSILQHNPDLVTGMELSYSLLNGLDERLDAGQRDGPGEFIWKAFGGLGRPREFTGLLMSSKTSEDFMDGRGRDAVSKTELFGMLFKLAYEAESRERVLDFYPNMGLPTIMAITFTDEYARVIQGALVRSESDPDVVELRISVSENLRYLDDTGTPIQSVWLRLLGWTFSRGVEATEGSGVAAGVGTGCKEESDRLTVPKARASEEAGGLGSDEDEALRKASKSTTASERKQRATAKGGEAGSGSSSPSSSPSSSSSG